MSDEHIIPAALGGEEVVRKATCSDCNRRCSESFEAEFTNSLKTICHIIGIGNRQGKVPSVEAVASIEGRDFDVVLHPDGDFRIMSTKEERVLPNGKKVAEYVLFTEAEVKTVQARTEKRGERFELGERQGRPIELEPVSQMRLNFLGEAHALRTAAKVAFMTLAKVAGLKFAASASFNEVRQCLRYGRPVLGRLFVSKSFAANMHAGSHQHGIQVDCDGRTRRVFATVTFCGGLSYLVRLSADYHGADYGFTYAYDSLLRQRTPTLVQSLETERLAIQDVLTGATTFDDVHAVAEHWLPYIQSVARREVIEPIRGIGDR